MKPKYELESGNEEPVIVYNVGIMYEILAANKQLAKVRGEEVKKQRQ